MLWQIFAVIVITLVALYVVAVRRLVKVSSSVFFTTVLGVIIGLSIGALMSLPLAALGDPFGRWLPIVVNVFSVALVTTFFYNQREQITNSFGQIVKLINTLVGESRQWSRAAKSIEKPVVVLDTSAIIDGRILELVKTGFVMAKMIVPRFVLDELQLIADSSDSLKRAKGRRGLEILNELGAHKQVDLEVVTDDFLQEPDVDSKIIRLAKKYQGKLMTVDYNLNRVAHIQNVAVLNVNELSNALRPVVLPGEAMTIEIIQAGKDEGQGVGYLADGTMVVVEGGDKFIGKEKTVVVTRVFQTVAGKMIFAMPQEAKVAAVIS